METEMRTPTVTFSPDDTIKEFIRKVVGSSTQDMMIGSEILFAAGLASRELSLFGGLVPLNAFRRVSTDKKMRESLSVEAAELMLQPGARNW
jgi:hypothetical protein